MRGNNLRLPEVGSIIAITKNKLVETGRNSNLFKKVGIILDKCVCLISMFGPA